MPHMIEYVYLTFFFNMKIATREFRNYLQYERALCRMTYTQMIAYTDFVSRHCLFLHIICTISYIMYKRFVLQFIEDICLFEMNTKYILSSEFKRSEFSRVRSTSENFDVFNSRDEIYLVFTEAKANFLFILYNTRAFSYSQSRR